MSRKPNVNAEGQKELDRVEGQIQENIDKMPTLNLEELNKAPVLEKQYEPAKQLPAKNNDLYLKPKTTIGSREQFNEKFRKLYEFKKEYVYFTAYNNEIIGESIQLWTKPFPGMPAQEWVIPVGKPVYAPRYVAEQIKNCKYHTYKMEEHKMAGSDGRATYYGTMTTENTVQRLDAMPQTENKSIFLSSTGF